MKAIVLFIVWVDLIMTAMWFCEWLNTFYIRQISLSLSVTHKQGASFSNNANLNWQWHYHAKFTFRVCKNNSGVTYVTSELIKISRCRKWRTAGKDSLFLWMLKNFLPRGGPASKLLFGCLSNRCWWVTLSRHIQSVKSSCRKQLGDHTGRNIAMSHLGRNQHKWWQDIFLSPPGKTCCVDWLVKLSLRVH